MIREPDRSAASITITPAERPLTMRLRRGKERAIGGEPIGVELSLCVRDLGSGCLDVAVEFRPAMICLVVLRAASKPASHSVVEVDLSQEHRGEDLTVLRRIA